MRRLTLGAVIDWNAVWAVPGLHPGPVRECLYRSKVKVKYLEKGMYFMG